MSEADIVAVMHNVCAGLAYVHSQGVLHRDLKPDNILRTQGGQWAIADFGLARAVADSASLTETGQGLGTRLYMAPEQLIDASRVTAAADIYSAGKVMQQMLTGTWPVTGDVPPGRLAHVVRAGDPPDHSSATRTQGPCWPRYRRRSRQATGSRRRRGPYASGSSSRPAFTQARSERS